MDEQEENIHDETVKVKAIVVKQEPGASPEQGTLGCLSDNGGIPASWLDDFPWLEFVDGQHGGVCRICIESGKEGHLTSTEHYDLLSHAWSLIHQEAETSREKHATDAAIAAKMTQRSPRASVINGHKSSKSRRKGLIGTPSRISIVTNKVSASKSRRYGYQRVRKFCAHWLSLYEWLEYNPQENAMYCKYCKKQSISRNSFVIGSRCFKRDALRVHDGCRDHILALNAESLSNTVPQPQQGPQVTLSRKSKFLLGKLLKHYPWLLFNAETHVLICDTCQRHNVNTLYVLCTQGIDQKAIQQHTEGKRHQVAMDAEVESWHLMFEMGSTDEDFQLVEVSANIACDVNKEVFLNNETDEMQLSNTSANAVQNEHSNDSTASSDGNHNRKVVASTPIACTSRKTLLTNHRGDLGLASLQSISRLKPSLVSKSQPKYNIKGNIQPSFGKFKSEWKQEFAWLDYDKEQDVMMCMLCKKHNKKNTFAKGIRVFLRSFITHHIKSVKHRKAMEQEAEESPGSPLLLLSQPQEQPPSSSPPNLSLQLTPTGRVTSTDAVIADQEPDEGLTMESPTNDTYSWHISPTEQNQVVTSLTERCQEIINSTLDNDISPDAISPDYIREYSNQTHTNGPYTPEYSRKGMVVLEKKKDGSIYRRVRKFCVHWLNDFPWLMYDSDDDVMRCVVCVKHQRSSAFTKGTRTFHIDNIKKHEGSSGHQRAMGLEMI